MQGRNIRQTLPAPPSSREEEELGLPPYSTARREQVQYHLSAPPRPPLPTPRALGTQGRRVLGWLQLVQFLKFRHSRLQQNEGFDRNFRAGHPGLTLRRGYFALQRKCKQIIASLLRKFPLEVGAYL